ncbi:MAG TPA: acyltransferase [Mucilaginibacter sp.]
MRQRIQTLDGLRFLAAIGVLWIHTWTAHGNPRFYIGKIDIANFMAIGVNGVELFFVISGFCMYYFYATKSEFSYHDFYRFLVKRWVRLSPAFYAATIIYITINKFIYHYQVNSLPNFLHSLFYLNYFFGQYVTASHFWTLTVEWQFYFTIPFILLYQNRIGFKKTFAIIFGIIFLTAVISVFILKNTGDLLDYTIIFRGTEFGCGVLAARLLIKNNAFFKHRALWLFAFIIITYLGRVLISKSILDLSYNYYNLFKLAGFTLMGIGFAGILYLSVTSVKWLNLVLGNRLFKTMGRISYSFYLLHALVVPVIAHFTIDHLPFFKGITAPVISTCLGALILYPISLLSYRLLEKPFLAIGNLTSR